MRIIVRPFQYGASDLKIIDQLDKEFFGDKNYEPHSLRQLLDLFSPLTFIAEQDDQPVGYVLGGVSSEKEPRAWVLSLVVRAQDKKELVANILIDTLLEEIKERRLSKTVLMTVADDNQLVKGVADDFKFKEVERITDYFSKNEDRAIFKKII
jgi:ribosomal protein S18 acetylase RimI-like enzyme